MAGLGVLDRARLASVYLRGSGLEIGALHHPLPVPRSACVSYVDRMTVAELRKQYPDLPSNELVEPDLIDNGETLSKVPAVSQDFVIANHFLEHCQDPIGTLENFFRVLKLGGILYLTVPDKHHIRS